MTEMNYNPNNQLPPFDEVEGHGSQDLSRVDGAKADWTKGRGTGRKAGSKGDKANVTNVKKRKGKYPLWKNVLAMIILLCLFVGGAYWATDIYTRHGEEVGTPDLKGLTVQQAMNRLDALGLIGMVLDSIYVRDMGVGLVCKQSIDPGNKVKLGRVVYMTVNSDKAECLILPDVADNGSVREVTAKLRALGFSLTEPDYIDGERDWVYSVRCKGRNISAGTRVEIDDAITLVVGNGNYMMDDQEFTQTYGEDSISIDPELIEIY